MSIIPSYEGNVTIAIDQKSLVSTSSFPQITGTATNVSSISVDINGFVPNDGSDSRGELALYAETVPVINNKWSFTPSAANEAHGGPQGLSRGTYTVVVGKTEQTPFIFSTLVVSQP